MKLLKMFLLPLIAFVFAGCAGYQLGSTLPGDVQTVSVSVLNQTGEPQIEVAVMNALRAEIQMDGRLKLRPENEADTTLTVTLNHFQLNPLAYDDRRGSFAREYRTVLSASSVLSRRDSGEVIVETPELLGESEFTYNDDLTSAKRRALPSAAADLARKAVSLVTTAW
jgi:outer membrane lipopolysaccharide assembly protein LptE/RlpB